MHLGCRSNQHNAFTIALARLRNSDSLLNERLTYYSLKSIIRSHHPFTDLISELHVVVVGFYFKRNNSKEKETISLIIALRILPMILL